MTLEINFENGQRKKVENFLKVTIVGDKICEISSKDFYQKFTIEKDKTYSFHGDKTTIVAGWAIAYIVDPNDF